MNWKTKFWLFAGVLNFCFAGKIIYENYCFRWLPKPDEVVFRTSEIRALFSDSIWFGLACGSAIILLQLLFHLTKTTSGKLRVLTAIFVLMCMVIAIYIRTVMLSEVILDYAAQIKQWKQIKVGTIDISSFHFASYAFIGIVSGILLSYLGLTFIHSRNKGYPHSENTSQ